MSDNTSNMETKTTRTVKEILADIETNVAEQVILQRTVKALYKELERSHKVEVKDASKRKKSTKDASEKRDPSGFNAKQPVPPEFCEQPWGCDADQELPRTMLTKMVYDYVKEENLQDPDDKRRIFPDDTLKKLFHLKDSDELHFNNFQTYMKRLYDRTFEDDDDDSSVTTSGSDTSDVEVTTTKGKGKKGKKTSKKTTTATTTTTTTTKGKGKKGKKSVTASQNL